MKCPTCKRAKCVWVELKPLPEKQTIEYMEKVIDHNLSYIDMMFRGYEGSSYIEERMTLRLTPYIEEIEKRRAKK